LIRRDRFSTIKSRTGGDWWNIAEYDRASVVLVLSNRREPPRVDLFGRQIVPAALATKNEEHEGTQ
jgi:hypothetical protein